MSKFIRLKKSERFIGLGVLSRILGFMVFVTAKISSKFSNKLQLAGDVASYSDWLKLQFGDPKRFFNRERLFRYLIDNELGTDIIVLEFGVAKGYLTEWVLNKDITRRIQAWHGFDTFMGLPDSWRNYSPGAFSNYGKPPNIDDSRITWHIGFAEERIRAVDLEPLAIYPLLIIFDMDLEQPTREVMMHLTRYLKPGDLLYFDEAFDHGERHVIVNDVIPRFKLAVLGTTPLAILFKITKLLP